MHSTWYRTIRPRKPCTTLRHAGSTAGGKHTCSEGLGSPLTGACGAAPFSAGAAALAGCAPSMSMGIGEGWLMLFTYVCNQMTAHQETVLMWLLRLRPTRCAEYTNGRLGFAVHKTLRPHEGLRAVICWTTATVCTAGRATERSAGTERWLQCVAGLSAWSDDSNGRRQLPARVIPRLLPLWLRGLKRGRWRPLRGVRCRRLPGCCSRVSARPHPVAAETGRLSHGVTSPCC